MFAVPTDLLRQSQRWSAVASFVALIGLGLLLGMPHVALFEPRSGELLLTHSLMEMVSVVVSVLVVVVAWYTPSEGERPAASALIFGFTLVALSDAIHARSYPGMPDLLSPSGTEKSIYFWLAGRFAEWLTVVWISLRLRLPGTRAMWFGAALVGFAGIFYVGTWQLEGVPRLFNDGRGVTELKSVLEVLLAIGNWVGAGYFWREYRRRHDARSVYFAAACWVMGLGELAFTNYGDVSELITVLGHGFKVLAYVLVFKATFCLAIQEPHDRLQRSESELRRLRAELDTILRYLPAGVARLDAQGRFLYVNDTQSQRLGKPSSAIVGQSIAEVMAPFISEEMTRRWRKAMQGEEVSWRGQVTGPNGEKRFSAVTMAPEFSDTGEVVGAVSVAIDMTEQYQLQQQLLATTNEMSDLRAALDAHAIVAVTDEQGVITQANDKFCAISQYARDELIGNTHALINSGMHSRAFFVDLWRTIVRGEVWSGEICNRAKDGSLYWVQTTIVPVERGARGTRQYISIRADITERKRIELEMQQMAYQDALTRLPNRRLLLDRLSHSLDLTDRSGQHGALIFIDLDNFKGVNDTLGHDQGDALLKMTALRLTQGVRKSDTVARLAGDEFVVLLADLGRDQLDATVLAGEIGEKLLALLSHPYALDGDDVTCTPSMGVVLYQGNERPADALLKQADIALYQAKEAGRNTLCFFDPGMQHDFHERVAMEADLRCALAKGQLQVHYQTVVNGERDVVGLEALLRWLHPVRGWLSPATFIPVAEKTGLIIPIGEWVLQHACELLQRWQSDPLRCRWNVAVNVSARQFRQQGFVAQVVAAMERHAVRPDTLTLEITESALLTEVDTAIEHMRQLRARGVRFALDDFGTGYSSLTYLKRLPIQVLKIDRSFVRDVVSDPNDRAIAKTILELAASMRLEVVAEGVESADQFIHLKEQGCQRFQGYLFSRPAALGDTPALAAFT